VTVQLGRHSSGQGGRVAAVPARTGVGFGYEPWRRRARQRAVSVGGAPQPRGACRSGKSVRGRLTGRRTRLQGAVRA